MQIKNGFRRGVLAFNAKTGDDTTAGHCTHTGDPDLWVEVPDDGASVVGLTGEAFGEECFWPASLKTAKQVGNAKALAKRHGLVLCPYIGEVSQEADEELQKLGL